ncbi:MAG: RluA family pseudouridine synthase [Alphaproteobacteria bacterium]|nr:RluA family pseudouridine synthase [Alphaproteobacteria bacterium]MCK5518542.1 RluA family pseudouridine synthase [Alphaproteobacteria bacterium]MCK5555333.1 RluA family pseudouridine synthase [Alphaproteobacteria bacterium]
MVENVTVLEEDDGVRLDRWLKKKYPDTTFSNLQKVLRTGQVRVDGKRVKGDARLVMGQLIRIPPQMTLAVPKNGRGITKKDVDFIQSLVLYKDEHVIAINKPAGLASQGGSGIRRHIDGMLDGLIYDGVRPHLVHRLDKDTSGILLLARNPKIARRMGELFQGRDIRKYYWAITVPAPSKHQGKIKTVIAKVDGPGGEKVRKVSEDKGKTAFTYYQVMDTALNKLAWVAFWPKTGRTHQIRVHALEIGCPLLGDYKYCYHQPLLEERPDLPNVLHLHSRRMILPHPVTGKKLDITAPLDTEMRKTWKFFNFNPEDKSDPFENVEA